MVFSGFEIKVFIHQKAGQSPSFVFLYRPPCFMADTNLDTPLDVERSQKRAQEFCILYLVARTLMTSSLPDTNLDEHPIFGNILVAHAVFIGFAERLHIGQKIAILVFKNFLTPLSCNAFDEQYHGFSVKNPDIIAVRLCQESRSVTYTHDNVFHLLMLNALSRGS